MILLCVNKLKIIFQIFILKTFCKEILACSTSTNKSPFVIGSTDSNNKDIFKEQFYRPNVSLPEYLHPTVEARYTDKDNVLNPVEADFAFRALYDIVDFEKFRENGLFGLCLIGNRGLVIQDSFVKFKDRV